jgi:signal transduction histidine kinase
MLYLTDRLDDLPFTEEDQWLVEALAGYAALAIAGTQLSEKQGRLTLLEERERVGMELHDGIIQSLYAIGIQLQLLRMTHSALDSELAKATKNLDTVIEDIRRYILNLKVEAYEQKTMRECLVDALEKLHKSDALRIHVDAPNRQPLFAPPVVEAVCQIAYEAVSNIIRHADATEAFIEVTEGEKQFQMVIRDNGQGFHADASQTHNGLGLHNMVQRARIHGGDVKIESVPGEGTRLTLRLPV